MVTNDLGACEWFVWDLRRSGLIDRGQLDSIVSEFLKRNPRAEAPALAEFLVGQGTLTAFQAERILNGKTQGLVLGPYVLLDAIGQGSMGQVYKATSKNDNLTYAVKVLPRRSMWNVRLARRQVRSFSQFSHAAVVPFVDVGTAGGLHYLTWPLAEGQTLEHMIQHNGRLSPQQSALIGLQVAQGLAICHSNNIFHGLLKPSNVMIGSDNQARVLDFGIGSLLAENEGESLVDTMSTANTLTSGLDCASPESIMEPTNRTPAGDQYSLGCILYVCLTGRAPFPDGSAVEKMMAHQTQTPTAIKEFAPDCPDALVAVVSKLMAKKPDDRYADTADIAEALEPHLGELATVAAAAGRRSSGMMPGLGSNPRMNGLGTGLGGGRTPNPYAAASASPMARSSMAGAFNKSSTPPPAPNARPAQLTPTHAPQPQLQAQPQPQNYPLGRGPSLPSRASFQLPQAEADLDLVPALMDPNDYRPGPAALRASAGWVTDADQNDQRGGRKGGLNVALIVALAVALMAAAFFGAKFFMK